MTRKVCSALAGVGMWFGLTAAGQEPPAPKPAEPPTPAQAAFADYFVFREAAAPAPGSLEEAIG